MELDKKRIAWGEPLRPLYGATGEIVVRFGAEGETYIRGDVEVETGNAADEWIFRHVSCLVRWEPWLRKARKATLVWLASQDGRLAAGEIKASQAVLSQLRSAGLVVPSDYWGDCVTEDGELLALWAAFELERRRS